MLAGHSRDCHGGNSHAPGARQCSTADFAPFLSPRLMEGTGTSLGRSGGDWGVGHPSRGSSSLHSKVLYKSSCHIICWLGLFFFAVPFGVDVLSDGSHNPTSWISASVSTPFLTSQDWMWQKWQDITDCQGQNALRVWLGSPVSWSAILDHQLSCLEDTWTNWGGFWNGWTGLKRSLSWLLPNDRRPQLPVILWSDPGMLCPLPRNTDSERC
jgi:hypothetical protein